MERHKAPGKSDRVGISLLELAEMFPNEETAVKWFEAVHWPEQRRCGHCKGTNTKVVKSGKPMPYHCGNCRKYFSVRTGTVIQCSNLPLRKWAFAVYLYVTNLKGVSSMKLHRDLGVTQKTAWFMLHRLREAWDASGVDKMLGPVEIDETYVGGKRENMPKSKRVKMTGRGTKGKSIVIGAKDRETNKVTAKVVEDTRRPTLQGFVKSAAAPGATVYTDEHSSYVGMPFKHEAVKHGVGEYVREQAHTNGIESFWAMLKRAHKGTFHRLSHKHLGRYIAEFAKRHNIRELDTVAQMAHMVAGTVGRRLLYRELIEDNGLDPTAIT